MLNIQTGVIEPIKLQDFQIFSRDNGNFQSGKMYSQEEEKKLEGNQVGESDFRYKDMLFHFLSVILTFTQ